MSELVDIVVIGAGPYGLSLAAHLHAAKSSFRIFGTPMNTWSQQMPEGMCLKSEGFASTLFGPGKGFTLEDFCKERGEPYASVGLPVKVETFVAYGREFQKRMVPGLEDRSVTSLEQDRDGFRLQLDNEEQVFAKKVVIAAGISHFHFLPPEIRGFDEDLVTHSSQHHSLTRFAGKDVTVLGGGASAIDLAALLHTSGAKVHVISRRSVINFLNPPGKGPRPILERFKAPMTGLGPGWRSLMCVKGPLLFHKMPPEFRQFIVKKHLGPAPTWFTKTIVVGNVDIKVESKLQAVQADGGRLRLLIASKNDETLQWRETDHLIAATGFRVDMQRLKFIHPNLASNILTIANAPVLSNNFQTNVKGLYFVGAAAATSFGPLLRFAYGAGFTASRLSRHLLKAAPQSATSLNPRSVKMAAS